jgi:uncharacterized protein (UPF0333 family)
MFIIIVSGNGSNSMATTISTESIKRDVEQLANIAIEDRISKDTVRKYHKIIDKPGLKGNLTEVIEHDITISEITGTNTISKKFADKLLSILSKYEFNKEKRIIVECIEIMLDTEKH